MENNTKKTNDEKTRVPLNITVLKEIYDWITQIRGNASRIAEQAYLSLKNEMEFGYGTDSILIKLAKTDEWTRR